MTCEMPRRMARQANRPLPDEAAGATPADEPGLHFSTGPVDHRASTYRTTHTGPRTALLATEPARRHSQAVAPTRIAAGYLTLWLDILTPEQATQFVQEDISLPPKEPYQLRVTIWKTRDVPNADPATGPLQCPCDARGCMGPLPHRSPHCSPHRSVRLIPLNALSPTHHRMLAVSARLPSYRAAPRRITSPLAGMNDLFVRAFFDDPKMKAKNTAGGCTAHSLRRASYAPRLFAPSFLAVWFLPSLC